MGTFQEKLLKLDVPKVLPSFKNLLKVNVPGRADLLFLTADIIL